MKIALLCLIFIILLSPLIVKADLISIIETGLDTVKETLGIIPEEETTCGDGTVQTPNDDDVNEVCDSSDFAGETCASQEGTNYVGTLNCSVDCLSINTTSCTIALECTSDANCTDPNLPVCNNAIGKCVECTSDTNCISPKFCDTNPASSTYQTCVLCVENWTCTSWSSCTNNQKTRTCTDKNNCQNLESIRDKPAETEACVVAAEESAPELPSPALAPSAPPKKKSRALLGITIATMIIVLIIIVIGIIYFKMKKKEEELMGPEDITSESSESEESAGSKLEI